MMIRFALLLSLIAAPALLQAKDLRVAATVKPLHSLVAGVMQGAGEPELILRGSESPHHYSLRPSERRTLANAGLVFWTGPEFEVFLVRLLQGDAAQRQVALIRSAGIKTLPARTVHDDHEAGARPDPHVWLSADNARAMVDEIAKQLSELDPGNQAVYQHNRERMQADIDALDAELRTRLHGHNSPFLSYHDAYQYFETAYALNNAGFVSTSEDLAPGARHVSELIERIEHERIDCLFYDAPLQPALVNTLRRGHQLQPVELDPLGLRLQAGTELWFTLMRNIASGFAGCLHPQAGTESTGTQ